MASGFKNYSAMIDSLAPDNSAQTAASNVATLKNKNDEILKTLGEAKTFISGRSLAAKVVPALKKKLTTAVEGKLAEAKDVLNQKVTDAFKGASENTETAVGEEGALKGAEAGSRGVAEIPNQAYDAGQIAQEGGVENAAENLMRPGGSASQTAATAGKVAGDDAEGGGEAATEEVGGTIKAADTATEAGVEETNIDSAASGITQADLPEGAGGGAGDLSGLGARTAAKEGVEEGAEQGATVGGEEAAAGLLDAIPGLDVIGVIGGAILAGIAGHKAHLEQEKVANSRAPPLLNMSYQSGIGNE